MCLFRSYRTVYCYLFATYKNKPLRGCSAVWEISDSQINLFVSAGFPVAVPSDFRFSGAAWIAHWEPSYCYKLDACCAHAFPSWTNTLLCSTFTTLSHLLPWLTTLPPSTPFSIQCRTILTTTTLLLKPQKIMTQPTFLLHLPLQPALAQKTLRRQVLVADGLKVKSHFSSTMLKKIVFWWLHEASAWRSCNSTRLIPRWSQRMLLNVIINGVMYVLLVLSLLLTTWSVFITILHYSYVVYTRRFCSGTRSPEVEWLL